MLIVLMLHLMSSAPYLRHLEFAAIDTSGSIQGLNIKAKLSEC